jgi:hypothetical protein
MKGNSPGAKDDHTAAAFARIPPPLLAMPLAAMSDTVSSWGLRPAPLRM